MTNPIKLRWNHLIFPFLLLLVLGCDSSKTDLEEEVLYSILPKVADSMVNDFRLKIPLPPPPPGLDPRASLDYAGRMAQSRKDYEK